MADFPMAYEECEEVTEYPVQVSEFEEQSEQRRLITSKRLVGFRVKLPNMTLADALSIRSFYQGKKGALTAFTFDFMGTTYKVRFDGQLQMRHSGGIYQGSCNLKLVDQAED